MNFPLFFLILPLEIMTTEQKLQKLILFLESKDINVKSDRGNFKGGFVRYHSDKYLYLNRKLDIESKIKIISNEINALKLDPHEIDKETQAILVENDQ